MSTIKVVGVVGAGTMGNGIAHVFARSGFQVVLCEVEQRFLDRGLETIRKNLEREAAKGKLTAAEAEKALGLIRGTLQGQDLAVCDFVIEAAPERFALKQELFTELDSVLKPEVDPGFQYFFHFHHPAGGANAEARAGDRDALLQSGPGDEAGGGDSGPGDHATKPLPRSRRWPKRWASRRSRCNDAPGFVSNRVLMPLLNEAMYAVMEGVATPAAVDQVFQLGMAHPMGPLALADFIGLDVCLDIMRVMVEGLGDPKYRPCPLLIRMVDAGWLGRKSGRGFYQY